MRACHAGFLCALSLVPTTAARAQTETEVLYHHYSNCKNTPKPSDSCTINETKRLEPGGSLKVTVDETRKDYFQVDVKGYIVQTKATEPVRGAALTDDEKLAKSPDETITIELTHNPKYGGYIVTISPTRTLRAEGEAIDPKDTNKGTVKMPGPAVIVVTIDKEDPPYAFSGGISLTSVRSQAFVARPTAGGGSFTIKEDPERRDAGTVGFATFVSVRVSNKADWFWPGIGIGLETGGNTQYYFGAGFRLVKGIFLNTGAVLGQVATLPAGLQLDDTITDPNQLSNLGHRKKFGAYVGLSFKFLGGGETAFGRPFVGAEGK